MMLPKHNVVTTAAVGLNCYQQFGLASISSPKSRFWPKMGFRESADPNLLRNQWNRRCEQVFLRSCRFQERGRLKPHANALDAWKLKWGTPAKNMIMELPLQFHWEKARISLPRCWSVINTNFACPTTFWKRIDPKEVQTNDIFWPDCKLSVTLMRHAAITQVLPINRAQYHQVTLTTSLWIYKP